MKYFKFIISTIALFLSTTDALTSSDRCGKDYDNLKCDSGLCCSQYGHCGNSEEHCSLDKKCQPYFGKCINYKSGNSTDRCGKDYDNQKCVSGLCCSQYGYCGTSEEHCSLDKKCQPYFGKCIDYNKTTIKKIGMINTGPGGDCSKEMSVAWHSPYSDNYIEYTLSSDTSFKNAKKKFVTGTFRGEDREFYDSNEKRVTFYSCKAYLENLSSNTDYIYRV